MEQKRLGEQNIYKLFFSYAIPAIISMVIAGAQTVVDGIFLGRYAGIDAMSGVSIVQPFIQIIFAVSFVICTGAISKIGRCLGNGDRKTAQSVFRTSSLLTTICTAIIVLVVVFFNQPIARLLGASDALIQSAKEYLLYFSLFSPIIGNMFLFGFSNRIIGKPNQYLFATIIMVAVNIAFNYLFIVQLQMGTKGAALASGIAYVFSFFICIFPFLKKRRVLNLWEGKINFKQMLEVCGNGASEAVTSLSTALTIYLFNFVLRKIEGDSGIAAFSIINYMGTFATLLMFGVADGIAPIISYNYGYEKISRVKKTLFIAMLFNLLAGIIVFTLVYIFANPIIMLFSNGEIENQGVIDLAVNGARLYSVSFMIIGFNLVVGGFFTDIGNALFSIIIAFSRGIGWIVLGMIFLPKILGINGVWLTAPFAETMTLIISVLLLIVANKKHKKKINDMK